MSWSFFDPDQRAAIRDVLLPTEASAEAILCAAHTIEDLAAVEGTSPQIGPDLSYKQQRDDWAKFKAMTEAYARSLLKVMPPRKTPDEDWWTLVRRGLGHLHAEAVDTVASLDLRVKQNSGRRNSHREEIYTRVLDIWTCLGGSLYLSHNQHHGTTTGAVIPFLRLVISLIFDEPVRSDDTLIGIVRRIRAKRPPVRPPP